MVVESGPLHPAVVAVNAATVAFVDEVLRLPSRGVAATTVALLYGRTFEALPSLLAHVNGGLHGPLARVLATPAPLVTLLGDRLRLSGAGRTHGQARRGARAWARARYRELLAAFVQSAGQAPPPDAALVHYTYGVEGRRWLWQEVAARLLHRVTALNRAVFDLLAEVARGAVRVALVVDGPAPPTRDFDLPSPVRDLLAAALPPVAVPDWARFAATLDEGGTALGDDEALERYRALLAEMLGRAALAPEPDA